MTYTGDVAVGGPSEVRELDHRHPLQPEPARGQHPAMARDDPVSAVDQHRVGEAELPDGARDQRHLRLGVGAGVARVGDQARERAMLEAEVKPGLEVAR